MRTLLTYLLLAAALHAAAQFQPLYSQYMFNGLAINPAYAGSREVFSAMALHRDQWTGMEGAPETQTLSAHMPLRKNKIGLGLVIYRDVIGVTDQKGVSLGYAYRIPFINGKLSFGISGTLAAVRSRWTSVITSQSGDEMFAQDSPSSLAPNTGAGIYYYSDKFYTGASVPALLHNTITSAGKVSTAHDLSRYNVMLSSGWLVPLGQAVFKPSVLVRYNSGSPVQLDINSSFYMLECLEVGASYRTRDAVVGIIGYNINKQFKIGYAYDHTLSAIRSYSRGSHELMLRYEVGHKVNAISPRYF